MFLSKKGYYSPPRLSLRTDHINKYITTQKERKLFVDCLFLKIRLYQNPCQ